MLKHVSFDLRSWSLIVSGTAFKGDCGLYEHSVFQHLHDKPELGSICLNQIVLPRSFSGSSCRCMEFLLVEGAFIYSPPHSHYFREICLNPDVFSIHLE